MLLIRTVKTYPFAPAFSWIFVAKKELNIHKDNSPYAAFLEAAFTNDVASGSGVIEIAAYLYLYLQGNFVSCC